MKEMQFSAQMTNYVYNGEGHAASMFTYDYNAGSRQPTSSGDRTQGCAYEATTFSGGELAAADSQRFSDFTHVYQQFSAGIGSDTPPVYYYGLRFYQPEVGRWLSRDPLREKGFSLCCQKKQVSCQQRMREKTSIRSLSRNQSLVELGEPLYLFCENSPSFLFDSIGLCTDGETMTAFIPGSIDTPLYDAYYTCKDRSHMMCLFYGDADWTWTCKKCKWVVTDKKTTGTIYRMCSPRFEDCDPDQQA